MQTPEEIECSYLTEDPWGFQSNPEDIRRKEIILEACKQFAPPEGFGRALDLGCGEGWITKDLPAYAKHGYELSKLAKSRLPKDVIEDDVPNGLYDLVITTGTLYSHYDYKLFFHLLKNHSMNIILTSNIKPWEREELSDPNWVRDYLGAKEVCTEEFQYREFIQKLRVFRKI